MPGNSAGTPQKATSRAQRNTLMRDVQAKGLGVSSDSDLSLEVLGDLTPELPKLSKARKSRKAQHRDSNGKETETIGFIPGTADIPPSATTCGSCAAETWERCKDLICCMVTCGQYKADSSFYIPCMSHSESSTDDVKTSEPKRQNGISISNPTCGIPMEANPKKPLNHSFNYADVKFKGVPVYVDGSASQKQSVPSSRPSLRSRRSSAEKLPGGDPSNRGSDEYYSIEYSEEDLDELNRSGADIDSLITQKLLELYSLHQIDQLAKCTSDSAFFKRTSEITELINDITSIYNLDEEDAECRLVHGVIRISTRKPKRPDPHKSDSAYHSVRGTESKNDERRRRDGNHLPDSGNDTMIESSMISQDNLEVKISEETSSDKIARNMRFQSTQVSGSPTANYSSLPETETNSSGAPLLKTLLRTSVS
ncbi:keratinocyte differentiation factor 1-like [Acipenser oxyrinchus oxyrinchus]|uniref:Keratinocyte differentiation factor 1-like n=1 Tax=Acipenser oxyrinchus oxyrinchus TaxID=40147 RepID=A0AAD8CWQ8_ACIOX|nr:keratinocyte differentiation factor 1-like [Acipenser oxyrinchus oxyrinchus]